MATESLTPEQKQAIRERLEIIRLLKPELGDDITAADFLALDVENLLAEIERLEKEMKP